MPLVDPTVPTSPTPVSKLCSYARRVRVCSGCRAWFSSLPAWDRPHGVVAGAALGLAGMANAATPSYNPEPRPGIVAVPQTKAKPAAEAYPGAWWHRHHPSLLDPSTASQFMAPFA